LSVIDTLKTGTWFSIKIQRNLFKEILAKNGLDLDDFSNKLGKVTLVTWMAKVGVPSEVGMDDTSKKVVVCLFWVPVFVVIVGLGQASLFGRVHVHQVIRKVLLLRGSKGAGCSDVHV
jgi:hypothetical protein